MIGDVNEMRVIPRYIWGGYFISDVRDLVTFYKSG